MKGEQLHKIFFYKDTNGENSILKYMHELKRNGDKNSRIKLNKINDYIQALSEYGTFLGKNYVKHIEGPIWELRPNRERIFFAVLENGEYVLLHHFRKATQKTPRNELDKARRELEQLKGAFLR